MHVCMISGYRTSAGGAENVVDELSNFLVKHNAEITIFKMYHRDFVEISQNRRIEVVSPYNILPTRLRFANYETYSYSLKVLRKIKGAGPFDIIHGHSGYCVFPALFRDKTPFIVTFHGLKGAFHYRKYGPNASILKNPRTSTLFYPEKILAKKCDLAIAPSKAVKDELIDLYGVDPMKIRVIYNGVNTSKFRPFDKKFARKILGLLENRNYGIWVGNNPRLKGLSTAIKTVRDLKSAYLLVVGVSGVNFENVIFWGEVQDQQLLCTLYNAADFLLFPTLYEGFPLVPLEAMACGLPIIISEESPTREIIKDGVEGFIIDKRETKYYSEKIKTILNNSAFYQEISLRARKLAEKYSWENQGKEYLKIYEQLTQS